MLNIRSTYGVLATCIALLLGMAALISYCYSPQHVAQLAAKHKNDQLDAITLAFLRKISRESTVISQADVLAVCIDQSTTGEHAFLANAMPEILSRLSKTIPKIQPYSYCQNLPERSKFFIYQLESFEQDSDEDAHIGIGYRDTIHGIYHDGMIYNMTLQNGKWTLGVEGPAWMS